VHGREGDTPAAERDDLLDLARIEVIGSSCEKFGVMIARTAESTRRSTPSHAEGCSTLGGRLAAKAARKRRQASAAVEARLAESARSALHAAVGAGDARAVVAILGSRAKKIAFGRAALRADALLCRGVVRADQTIVAVLRPEYPGRLARLAEATRLRNAARERGNGGHTGSPGCELPPRRHRSIVGQDSPRGEGRTHIRKSGSLARIDVIGSSGDKLGVMTRAEELHGALHQQSHGIRFFWPETG
jgi:hypothetical protein